MGYSNVQGDLNVLSLTSTQSLTVRGDATVLGNLTHTNGLTTLGNVTAANLTVTGNFTVTATNTAVTNALSINNAGTATALRVVQFEGGGPGHTHNVAEFWDFTTLAMVIDPEGNVGIHTTSSPGYALTVNQGAYIDTLVTGTVAGSGAALSSLTTANLTGPVTATQLVTAQTNVTSLGTLTGLTVQGLLTASNGSGITNLTAAAITGNVANANVALVVSQPAQPNVTSLGTLTALSVTGGVTGGFFSGSGNTLSNLNASNVAFGALAPAQLQTAQTNITSLGTLTSLAVTGATTSGWFSGSGNVLSNLNASNVAFGALAPAQLQAAQTNVTSLGTLTALSVTGAASAGWFSGSGNTLSNLNASNVAFGALAAARLQAAQTNVTSLGTLTSLAVTGAVSAGWFVGSGNTLSNINASNVAFGTVANLAVANTVTTTNIVAAGFTSNSTNTVFNFDTLSIPYGYFTLVNASSSFIGSGNTLSNLNASNVAFGALAPAQLQAAQTNVTSLGTLTALSVTGATTSGWFAGSGNTLSNLNASNVAFGALAPAQLQTAQGNITSLGTLTSLAVTGATTSGWFSGSGNTLSNLNASNVAFGALAAAQLQAAQTNVTSLGTLTSLAVTGAVAADSFVGSGNTLSNLNASNVSFGALAAAQLQAAQTNVTSLGTLTDLSVAGATTSGWFAGSGNTLSNLNASNVSFGALAAAQLQTAQGNITSLGTLTSLTVSGLVTGDGGGLTNVRSSVLVGNVAQANVALVVSQPAQPNVTSLGTLTALTVSGLVTGDGGGLTNVQSSVLVGNVARANVALVVSQPAQPNITSVGTLTALTVSGLVTGDGGGLTNLQSSTLVGNVANANVALVVSQAAQPNVTSLGTLTALTVSGATASGWFAGSGNVLSNLNASNVSFGALAPAQLQAAQTNVTSLGTLTSLAVTGATTSGWFAGSGNTLSNLNASNVSFGALAPAQLQAAQTNVTSLGTLSSLTVSGNSNLQVLNVASIATPAPVPASSGLFMNLNATYSLNSTGNWTGNIAGGVTANLYTLFAPNPVASWTTYGSNPLITGPSANGGFRFNQTGPYQFTVVLTSDNNIKTIALSSNTSDIHSNLADPGVWLYCYRISVGQDPSVPVQIPFYVDSTSKSYFIDFEAMKSTDNIHKTAYTNVTAEGYTGSYVTLRPL